MQRVTIVARFFLLWYIWLTRILTLTGRVRETGMRGQCSKQYLSLKIQCKFYVWRLLKSLEILLKVIHDRCKQDDFLYRFHYNHRTTPFDPWSWQFHWAQMTLHDDCLISVWTFRSLQPNLLPGYKLLGQPNYTPWSQPSCDQSHSKHTSHNKICFYMMSSCDPNK